MVRPLRIQYPDAVYHVMSRGMSRCDGSLFRGHYGAMLIEAAPPSKEHVRREQQIIRPTIQRILEIVADEFKVTLSYLIEGGRGIQNEERKVAFLFFWKLNYQFRSFCRMI